MHHLAVATKFDSSTLFRSLNVKTQLAIAQIWCGGSRWLTMAAVVSADYGPALDPPLLAAAA